MRDRATSFCLSAFWGCGSLLAYVYLGYPALAWVWSRVRPRPVRRAAREPSVSVLIVAHDEAARVAARLENVLALDYPRDQMEIVLASDGSTDGTAEIARAYTPDGVTVLAFERRRGKAAVLNDLVGKARGEIVVLADARQIFERRTLRALVEPFADPRVGAVSGELVLTHGPEATAVGHGVGVYWRYEKMIRRSESRVDSTIGATGAIYALRRDLFEPIPEDTVADDVLIPLRIVRQGYRVLFEPEARAYDREAARAEQEFRRKARTLAGTFQLFARERWLLDPRRNRLWFQTLSHKGLRLLLPLLHAGALIADVSLARRPFHRRTLLAQTTFYLTALAGYALRNEHRRTPLLSVPYAVCLLNGATLVGFVRFLRGTQRATWDRTAPDHRPPRLSAGPF
jgi:poly-beta-1,6-N-acetyl-D-glucosamine synthase